nr:MAG TPA: hypothetical protein [Caudoviricetes sp.]
MPASCGLFHFPCPLHAGFFIFHPLHLLMRSFPVGSCAAAPHLPAPWHTQVPAPAFFPAALPPWSAILPSVWSLDLTSSFYTSRSASCILLLAL